MIPVNAFAGKTVAVFGLGGSGLMSARAQGGGGEVIACDDDPKKMEEAAQAGSRRGFARCRLVEAVRARAYLASLTHPAPRSVDSRAAAVEVTATSNCSARTAPTTPKAPFVAITGTNGKSTTTALIGHLLRSAGHDAQLGGNIGTAILSLEPPRSGRV
jgi:UDP-N-acetylmuramoylalanine--D-glutamate ligase